MESGSRRYRFGVFEFEPQTLELRKNGRPLSSRPQSLRVLELLIIRAGELVTREEIQKTLWGGDTFVDFEQGINHSIKQLRAVLGDTPESPRFIQTLPRRGYRFLAPVEVLATHEGRNAETSAAWNPHGVKPPAVDERVRGQSRTRSRWRLYATYAAAAGTIGVLAALAAGVEVWRPGSTATQQQQPALVVLPFASSSDSALGVGLADAVSARLSGQRVVSVRSPTAVRRSLGARKSSAVDAGRAVGADLVLEGQVSIDRDDVSVVVRLTNAHTEALIWSERLRVRADQLFSVEDVVVQRVISALQLQLAAAEQERLRRGYSNNREAYDAYLRGRAALVEYTPNGARRAVAAFERALEYDGRYALARAGLAMACADMYLRFAPPADVERWGDRAETEAGTALALEADLAEAHLARAAVARKREFDWGLTIEASRRALVLNPNLDQAHFFIAAAYYHLGYMEEARIELERGRRLRSIDVVEAVRVEALIALFSGNLTSARVLLEEVSRRSSPGIGDTYLALAYYYTGNVDRGRTMLESLAKAPSASMASRASAALAAVLAAQGEQGQARTLVRSVLSREYRDHHVAYSLGTAYAQLGEVDEAFQWLRTAAATGFPCLTWFERDLLLDPLRRDPRFVELLERVRTHREASLLTVTTAFSGS